MNGVSGALERLKHIDFDWSRRMSVSQGNDLYSFGGEPMDVVKFKDANTFGPEDTPNLKLELQTA